MNPVGMPNRRTRRAREWDPLRNRFHYPPDVPAALLGSARDPDLYARDHPGNRTLAQGSALSELAIRIDAGSRDSLHAHDGAEHLHRLLWDLDVAHEYVLLRDADHVGPSIVPRLEAAFRFVGRHLGDRSTLAISESERALHEALEPTRQIARATDPSMARRYGRL